MFLIFIITTRNNAPDAIEVHRSYKSKADIIHDFSLLNNEGGTISNPHQVAAHAAPIKHTEPLAYNITGGIQKTISVMEMDACKEYDH